MSLVLCRSQEEANHAARLWPQWDRLTGVCTTSQKPEEKSKQPFINARGKKKRKKSLVPPPAVGSYHGVFKWLSSSHVQYWWEITSRRHLHCNSDGLRSSTKRGVKLNYIAGKINDHWLPRSCYHGDHFPANQNDVCVALMLIRGEKHPEVPCSPRHKRVYHESKMWQ